MVRHQEIDFFFHLGSLPGVLRKHKCTKRGPPTHPANPSDKPIGRPKEQMCATQIHKHHCHCHFTKRHRCSEMNKHSFLPSFQASYGGSQKHTGTPLSDTNCTTRSASPQCIYENQVPSLFALEDHDFHGDGGPSGRTSFSMPSSFTTLLRRTWVIFRGLVKRLEP